MNFKLLAFYKKVNTKLTLDSIDITVQYILKYKC